MNIIQDLIKKMPRPVISDYQKKLEQKGWIHLGNYDLISIFEGIGSLELIFDREKEKIEEWKKMPVLVKDHSLPKRIKNLKDRIKMIHPEAEKIIFAKAYDTYGNKIQKEELCFSAYMKVRLQ